MHGEWGARVDRFLTPEILVVFHVDTVCVVRSPGYRNKIVEFCNNSMTLANVHKMRSDGANRSYKSNFAVYRGCLNDG